MIDKLDVKNFFDRCAPFWDANMVRHEDRITAILDNAGVLPGTDILDVACGTGVLFPDYIARQVASITAIDLSPEMVKIAASKYPPEQVTVICGDVEETQFDRQFDVVMVYNAFPHFPDAAKLIEALAAVTKPGGRLSVAHSMSRAQLDHHHSGSAHPVSNGLMHEDDLAALFAPFFDVDVKISNDQMYQVSGVRKAGEGSHA
jgi:demethylmenaquinone methyltransferase/2-methoxy-6-polyprenyl-1,4-benzoquinol methylase